MKSDYITGQLQAGSKTIPVVATRWGRGDYIDTVMVRWSVRRMSYKVEPGIYAVGSPTWSSHVFVTANYKLSFDHLRRALDGINGWILVINTKGINVWCAAGKGTFSTKEIVNRIQIHHLEQLVDHHRIILPQLSATGVEAHEVRNLTGFKVIYGPVRASDIKVFIDAGMKATDEMRTMTFPLKERIKLIPMDILYGGYYLILVPAVFFILSGLSSAGYSVDKAIHIGWKSFVTLLAGYLVGCVLTPILLPYIPFRMFSLKGLSLGLIAAVGLALTGMLGVNPLEIASWFLMIGGLSSFIGMNFTGSSTYTSLSGVQKEMKVAFPIQIIMTGLGLAGWIISRFIT